MRRAESAVDQGLERFAERAQLAWQGEDSCPPLRIPLRMQPLNQSIDQVIDEAIECMAELRRDTRRMRGAQIEGDAPDRIAILAIEHMEPIHEPRQQVALRQQSVNREAHVQGGLQLLQASAQNLRVLGELGGGES